MAIRYLLDTNISPRRKGESSEYPCTATDYEVIHDRPFPLDPADRYLVCVGAVGYPRDGIRKPRYCIYDTDS